MQQKLSARAFLRIKNMLIKLTQVGIDFVLDQPHGKERKKEKNESERKRETKKKPIKSYCCTYVKVL